MDDFIIEAQCDELVDIYEPTEQDWAEYGAYLSGIEFYGEE
jgi:hypothetical protein